MTGAHPTPFDLLLRGMVPLDENGIVLPGFREAARLLHERERRKRLVGWRGGATPAPGRPDYVIPPVSPFLNCGNAVPVDSRWRSVIALASGLRQLFPEPGSYHAVRRYPLVCEADQWSPCTYETRLRSERAEKRHRSRRAIAKERAAPSEPDYWTQARLMFAEAYG